MIACTGIRFSPHIEGLSLTRKAPSEKTQKRGQKTANSVLWTL